MLNLNHVEPPDVSELPSNSLDRFFHPLEVYRDVLLVYCEFLGLVLIYQYIVIFFHLFFSFESAFFGGAEWCSTCCFLFLFGYTTVFHGLSDALECVLSSLVGVGDFVPKLFEHW